MLVVVGILIVAVYVLNYVPPSGRQSRGSEKVTPRKDQPVGKQEQPDRAVARIAVQHPQQIPSTPMELSVATSASKVTATEVARITTPKKLVALTFDAGSSSKPVPSILRTLASQNLRCTFFLVGQWVERNPELAKQIAEAGHEIGNHSWSHPEFTSLSDERIREELLRTEEIIQQVCKLSTKPLFRPPYGARDQRVRQIVAEEGYLTIYWSVDSWDSVKKDITPQTITERVMSRIRPGAIVLMHCGSEATAQALPQLLNALDSQGYQVVTVTELLRAAEADP